MSFCTFLPSFADWMYMNMSVGEVNRGFFLNFELAKNRGLS